MSYANRLGSATTYASAIQNIARRQVELAGLQENMTSGKRVNRASDDPTSAAQAERATTRIARIAADQRALAAQRDTMALAESTLGDAHSALQDFRTLVVNAGNGTLTPTDRASIAQRLTALREQIYGYANQQDSNGVPLYGGLGAADTAFSNTDPVQFQGLGGQRTGGNVSVAPTIDGQAAFMNVPTGNGVFTVATGAANTGTAWADAGTVTNPTAVTGHDYSIAFAVDATTGATTYTVTDTTVGTTTPAAAYKEGAAIVFDGQSLVVKGKPANGDSLAVAPSDRSDVFKVMDQAIADITAAKTTTGALPTQLAQSLAQIDAGLARLQTARGHAGNVLNQVDRISDGQEARSTQLEGERSAAEDLDMIRAISDFQNRQTGYSAALSSYAQIQKLSLFTFIG
ncbi:flagellar hook-associated protein FlgL [uncultured Xylophilus sp.]|uniref:flagellar hook-associated protein FlgL n=1 Tax=uncultured Xylophilus sp. TaxID=296832 RepID=UPI0025F9E641|nr:flagellar hook-associated protein FlgL [uncultured Xylophilus sp.]